MRRLTLSVSAAAAALVLVAASAPPAPPAMDFPDALARVDNALRRNPTGANPLALESCRDRRNYALQLYNQMQTTRAERSLRFCFDVLGLSHTPPKKVVRRKGPDMEAIRAQAAREIEMALELTPNIANGLEVYRNCAACHQPEGWGLSGGMVPQLAGQHRSVVIKQLADIRAGNRVSTLMLPYASVEAIGGAQAVADVAAYIDTLEMSVENGKGPESDLALGERLYGENCARCHGASGEGDADAYVPRIHAQHYDYLRRQFEAIKLGKRRNGNAEMAEQIQRLEEGETQALLDYVSRLEPPAELRAPPGWYNPDFSEAERM